MTLSKNSAVILLVDDNKMGLAARKHVLEELGYRTVIASSATVAIELFTKNKFDLVVTDYKMPDLSGVELIQQLRVIDANVPVILISGFVDVLGLDEQTTGADVVMMKNANEVSHLVRAAGRLINRKIKKPVASVELRSQRARKKSS